ncbi:MAG: hypothetical protein EBS38_02530 [Actinobacteria bacterium]|nr:hypothetical protein [Actinomycetota bacterium]
MTEARRHYRADSFIYSGEIYFYVDATTETTKEDWEAAAEDELAGLVIHPQYWVVSQFEEVEL